jgi:hypothetical protein
LTPEFALKLLELWIVCCHKNDFARKVVNDRVKFSVIQSFYQLSMRLPNSEIVERLIELKNEHSDLDEIIAVLIKSGEIDEIKIKRLKKRKLSIKDMIQCYENMLIPDIDA